MKGTILFLTTVISCITSFSQAPEDNLVFHLPVIGDATDESDSDLDCFVTGATLTEDRLGNPASAYSFNGTDNYISTDETDLLDLKFPFTLSIWFKVNEFPEVVATLFKTDAQVDLYTGFWLSLTPAGELAAGYGDATGIGVPHRVSKRTNAIVVADTWHQFIAVFNDESDIDMYLDCEPVAGEYTGGGSGIVYNGGATTIGQWDFRKFNGKLDNIRVYDDALTLTELGDVCEERPLLDIPEIKPELTPISIYPNPSNESILITLDNSLGSVNEGWANIYDATGRLCETLAFNTSNFEIDLVQAGLESGIYTITLIDKNANLISRSRFVFTD
ncbi:MAG: T9SS type A sorting domain-containing protein [Crocinitomix sp.]|nr:T9SS type A sorting domain-containing protein [Crocinitomix sp.]